MPYVRKKRREIDRQIFGFPGFPGAPGPQQGPQGPFGGQSQGQGAPSTPPPNIVPNESQAMKLSAGPQGVSTLSVDPGAVFPCRFRMSYIWLHGGRSFWAYITFVGRTSMSGFRWNGRRWVYFGVDLRRVRSFICY